MKKGLIRALSIINFIFIAGTLAILFMGAYKVEGFGQWVVDTWNNIFSQAKTLENLWIRLPKICAIVLSAEIAYGILLYILDEVCYSENCELDVPPVNTNEGIKIIEEKHKDVDSSAQYRTRVVLGRREKHNDVKKGSKDMKSREERKAEREAKKAAKAIKKAAVEDVEAGVNKAETKSKTAIDNFLNNLKK